LATRTNGLKVMQASLLDINELDQAYALTRPKDPDRVLYKLLHKYYPGGVYVLRKGRKLVSAAYCIGFPTGSGCVGGFFLDHKNGHTDSILAVIRRCLLHLRVERCSHVFASAKEHNLEDLGALRAAGFTELYRRRMGIIHKRTQVLPNDGLNLLCSQSAARETMERYAESATDTPEKGTVAFCFWPHQLFDASLNYLLSSNNIFAMSSGKDKSNLVLAGMSSAQSTGRRWFILPPNFTIHPSKQLKKVGEIMLVIGTDVLPVSAAISRLMSSGAERVYIYNYESRDNFASYVKLGFFFEQPQIILSRSIRAGWPITRDAPKAVVSTTLDQY
jgi:hypothetical protein